MRTFGSHTIGVDQGDIVLFSDFEDDGEMWTGEGPRLIRRSVRFADSYAMAPVVQVSLSMWDMSNGSNARADVTAERVTRDGFDIVFRTWSDTRVARVRVAWLSIGPVEGDDGWTL
ncbi:H-type lectin domain-containing protein [Loktanella fryxellensis]|uniref:H-type lectin domain-containing protein n=1 Tax=Loktanella fryxellensis TaxID=245187 RepID=A0A1H8DBD4_9RHOB|nr:H-type lectin domain-containing protein [Loktanella fryxellensis]SEN04476.1 H-type lectin domain-containing protein [Loktanella fryxellensis]